MALTDQSGQFIAANPAYQAMHGYNEEELDIVASSISRLKNAAINTGRLLRSFWRASAGNFKSRSNTGERTAA